MRAHHERNVNDGEEEEALHEKAAHESNKSIVGRQRCEHENSPACRDDALCIAKAGRHEGIASLVGRLVSPEGTSNAEEDDDREHGAAGDEQASDHRQQDRDLPTPGRALLVVAFEKSLLLEHAELLAVVWWAFERISSVSSATASFSSSVAARSCS